MQYGILLVLMSIFDWSGFLTTDPVVRPIFNRYLLGQAVGVLPMMLSAQLSAFLSLENNTRRTTIGSIIFIVVNVLLNALFVIVLDMGVFGLALASALGLWVFFAIQAQYFISGKSTLQLSLRNLFWGDSREIITIGVPLPVVIASVLWYTARKMMKSTEDKQPCLFLLQRKKRTAG